MTQKGLKMKPEKINQSSVFDSCSQCDCEWFDPTVVCIIDYGYFHPEEEEEEEEEPSWFERKPYLVVQPEFCDYVLYIACSQSEMSVFSQSKLPIYARICMHNKTILHKQELKKAGTVGQSEKVEENQDSVKFAWSIPVEFERRIKAKYKRFKAEKKKWKRDFKALKDWTANFQQIIENAQKSLSIIGDQNEKGTQDEN